MTTIDQIRRQYDKFSERFAARDAAGVANLYTATARLFPPGAEPLEGTEAIRGFWAEALKMGMTGIQIDVAEVEDLGDTAIESGAYTLTLPDGSRADHGKYLVMWKRVSGEWKLHRDIWNTSMAAAKTSNRAA